MGIELRAPGLSFTILFMDYTCDTKCLAAQWQSTDGSCKEPCMDLIPGDY